MGKQHRPLLPAKPRPSEAKSEGSSSAVTAQLRPISKRRIISQACEPCRKRKEKCDGQRPTCIVCTRRGASCTYAQSRYRSHATDLDGFKQQCEVLQSENQELRDLFILLCKVPEIEAQGLFTQIRGMGDPVAALNFALQAQVARKAPDPLFGPNTSGGDPRVERLNLEALNESPIKVRAQPWTQVAGDGLVSELITSFFVWDEAFLYSFIDRDAFLHDMQAGRPDTAKYCSRFLVNAICTARCFTSRNAKKTSLINGKDVATQFLDDAKKLLDSEKGRASIPTVQGLLLLFAVSASKGADRAGMMYRYAAYEMLHRLNLEKAFNSIREDPLKSQQKHVLAKALWGFFCFESLISYVYLEKSMLRPPGIPKYFATYTCEAQATPAGSNVDMFGNPFTAESRPPAVVPGTFHVICDLSEFLYRSMEWNTKTSEIGSDEDLKQRASLHAEVMEWHAQSLKRFKVEYNLTPQTCSMRVYLDEVLISILRPLHRDTIFHDGRTVKDLCIEYVSQDTQVTEQYVQAFSLNEYSCITLLGLYNAVLTVIPFLEDRQTHQLLARACRILRWQASDFPMAGYILQSVRAMAWSLKVSIPQEAATFLNDLGPEKDDLNDLPLALALPKSAIMSTLSAEDDESSDEGMEMGLLLAKWSAMSINDP